MTQPAAEEYLFGMNLVCSPYVSVETNAFSWLMLAISPDTARAILEAKTLADVFSAGLKKIEGFASDYRPLEIPADALSLTLFDDERLAGGDDILLEEWRAVPDDFAPQDDETTVFRGAGVRFSGTGVVFVFYPEHYKGSAESLELSYHDLERIASGAGALPALDLSAVAE